MFEVTEASHVEELLSGSDAGAKIEKESSEDTRFEVSSLLTSISEKSEVNKDILQEILSPEAYDQLLVICDGNRFIYNWFLQVVGGHDGLACVQLLINYKDVYGSDTIKLEQFVVVGRFRDSRILKELLNANDVYGDDYIAFMKFANVAQKVGPMQIYYLAEAKKVCNNDEMFSALCNVALQSNSINKLLFIIKTQPIYRDSIALFDKMITIASQKDFDTNLYFPKLDAVKSNRVELLKVVMTIACDTVPKMPLP